MSEDKMRGSLGRNASGKPKIKKLRKNHLLVIGIDKYQNGITPLNNAVRDAMGFKQILLSHYQFDPANVKELYDQKASKDAILDQFDDYLGRLTENDNLVVYFSGHGEVHKFTQKGYWIPADAQLGSRATYLPNSEVLDFFKYSKAHHVFGIVDSCFSGALFQTKNLSNHAQRLDNIPSRWLLTAGRLELVSDGSLGENSPFAKSLMTHLKYNEKKSLWASQLCDNVLEAVSYNAEKQTPRGEPLQNAGHLGGQFVFYQKDYVPVMTEEEMAAEPSGLKRGITTETVVPPASDPIVTPPAEPATFDELKQQLKMHLAMDEFDKFFVRIRAILKPGAREFNTLILFQGRYSRNHKKEMEGLEDPRDLKIEFNRLRQGLTYMIDQMDKEDLKPEIANKFN